MTTKADPMLQSCDLCGCQNAVQVHLSEEVLRKVSGMQGLSADEFPEWCWKGAVLSNEESVEHGPILG